MTSENRAYSKLCKLYPRADWQRIETWTEPGVFDVNGCLLGVEIWVECKQSTRPKTQRGLVRCKVRRGQISWEYRRRQAGGRTFVALMLDEDLLILPGETIKALKGGVTESWLESKRISPHVIFYQQPPKTS